MLLHRGRPLETAFSPIVRLRVRRTHTLFIVSVRRVNVQGSRDARGQRYKATESNMRVIERQRSVFRLYRGARPVNRRVVS